MERLRFKEKAEADHTRPQLQRIHSLHASLAYFLAVRLSQFYATRLASLANLIARRAILFKLNLPQILSALVIKLVCLEYFTMMRANTKMLIVQVR